MSAAYRYLPTPPYGGRVRFSIAIPQFDSDDFDTAELRAYLARAEELGFEGGWTLEQIIGEAPSAGAAGAAGVLPRPVPSGCAWGSPSW